MKKKIKMYLGYAMSTVGLCGLLGWCEDSLLIQFAITCTAAALLYIGARLAIANMPKEEDNGVC